MKCFQEYIGAIPLVLQSLVSARRSFGLFSNIRKVVQAYESACNGSIAEVSRV